MLSTIAACIAVAVICSVFFDFVAAESSRPSSRPTTIGIAPQQQVGPEQKICDDFYFYDHGTELCEHCRDICDAATVRGTVEQCWESCKPYALRLWPPKLDNPDPAQDDEDEENSGSPSLPLEAQIAIPLVAAVLIGLVGLGLVILRRKKNQNDLKNRRPPTTVDDIELTALNLLNEQDENGSQAVAESMIAAQGTEAGSSRTGVQEEGGSVSEGGSQAEGGGGSVTQATSSLPHDQGTRGKVSIPVSPEGQNASYVMALPHSPKIPHTRPAPQARREISQTDSEFNLDSTELKTILPSLSNDSLQGDLGACGGQTTFDV